MSRMYMYPFIYFYGLAIQKEGDGDSAKVFASLMMTIFVFGNVVTLSMLFHDVFAYIPVTVSDEVVPYLVIAFGGGVHLLNLKYYLGGSRRLLEEANRRGINIYQVSWMIGCSLFFGTIVGVGVVAIVGTIFN